MSRAEKLNQLISATGVSSVEREVLLEREAQPVIAVKFETVA